jgi:hypothetical protein
MAAVTTLGRNPSGWLKDKFGVSWQITRAIGATGCKHGDGRDARHAIALVFGGRNEIRLYLTFVPIGQDDREEPCIGQNNDGAE